MSSIVFYLVAALVIFTALKMVLSTNLVHSALFMAATFFGIAMLYLILNADYLAVIQIMIYVGAISILLVFGIMLTKRSNMEESSQFNRYRRAGLIVAAAMFIVLAGTVLTLSIVPGDGAAAESSVMAIANLLLSDDSIAFEVSGFLLLVATIGAIVIGKGATKQK
jgi:NADH-quinone oxidoreductase subunit J